MTAAERTRRARQDAFLSRETGNWGSLRAVTLGRTAPPWYVLKNWCRSNLEGFWLRSNADNTYFFQIDDEASLFATVWKGTHLTSNNFHIGTTS